MKFQKFIAIIVSFTLVLCLFACDGEEKETVVVPPATQQTDPSAALTDVIDITLSNEAVTCDSDAVFTANDIIYYEDGHDETYGEGEAADAHSAEEAAAHTVVHITKPGNYRLSGTLDAGQIFVDLGEDATNDPNACVALILDNVDITCTVAPAVFFYRVYECGDDENFVVDPDLTNAGAVVYLADDSVNNIKGAYVARIYEPGTTDKLHKYDAAFFSKCSMRIEGNTGYLNIEAENEGLDTELHLTVNGGNIAISSQDDGINTNVDGISVTTINGGALWILGGLGEEGDGIDSNGALVINGGNVYAMANEKTGDGGIDADLGIYLNGGLVVATGSRNDSPTSLGSQQFMELFFASNVALDSQIKLLSGESEIVSFTADRAFSSLTLSAPSMAVNTPYTLTVNGVAQTYTGNMGFVGMGRLPHGGEISLPEGELPMEGGMPDFEIPSQPQPEIEIEGIEPPTPPEGEEGEIPTPPEGEDGERPTPPEGEEGERPTPPEGEEGEIPIRPEGQMPEMPSGNMQPSGQGGTDFVISDENHSFSGVCDAN